MSLVFGGCSDPAYLEPVARLAKPKAIESLELDIVNSNITSLKWTLAQHQASLQLLTSEERQHLDKLIGANYTPKIAELVNRGVSIDAELQPRHKVPDGYETSGQATSYRLPQPSENEDKPAMRPAA